MSDKQNNDVHSLMRVAAYRPGITEFAAASFTFDIDGGGFVRIAFGNAGPFVGTDGHREPVFHHAVTISAPLAVDLARQLLSAYAAPGFAAGLDG